MISEASATWQGSWHEGAGTISTASATLRDLPFSYASRFADEPGGNPEELFALAFAGCLTQALANTLDWGNYKAEGIETTVRIELEMGERSPTFKGMHIVIHAKVPGIKDNQFAGLANAAKTGCMISRWLKIEPTMEATVDAS
jgi:osmotically inducible protein OsmC